MKFPGTQLLLREAALLIFCDPLPEQCARLRDLSGNEWRALLRWLDTSGLALYFLDRVVELKLCGMLPPDVLTRLRRNLIDNTGRMRGMMDESIAIHRDFQSVHLSYATLKGFSLSPYSVPKPELRSQLDLDFLIAEKDLPEARQVLERRGYHLHAVSGRSWEFKTDEVPGTTLKDLYKNVPYRCVELHVESSVQGQPSLLARTGKRAFHGAWMPVLSPVDLFLGQGLHLYKHMCSEFSRTAHLLEFRRHVLARRDDDTFWRELQSIAENNPRAVLGLGLVTLLITHVMGDFAPEPLTCWSVPRLPETARLWVELYGPRSVFASFPGSKLYLLLQRELESAGVPAKRTRRQVLLPLCLPPPITQASVNDSLPMRARRYRLQLRFIFFRLRFHIAEGLHYTWESLRWQRRMNRLVRRDVSPLDSSCAPAQLPGFPRSTKE